jgi:cytochrome c-type biogenesis protein CcmH
MTVFWIMTALLTALAGLLVIAGARRGADAAADSGAEVGTTAASAELAELDRLKARGLLDEAGWTAARAEAGRRILSASRETAPVAAGPRDRLWVLGGLGATAT